MAQRWTPPLQLHPRTDRCELSLVGVATAHGATLQEATNNLLVRVHDVSVAVRRCGISRTGAFGSDPQVIEFLWEIGDIVARGGDIRTRILDA